MGLRGTGILALLLLITAVIYWSDEPVAQDPRQAAPGRQSRPAGSDEPTTPLLVFEPQHVVSIRLQQGQTWRATQRTTAGWSDAANPVAVNDFLATLASLRLLAEIPANAEELKEFGLDPPQAMIHLQLRGAEPPLILQIGSRNPSTTGVYVRFGSDGGVGLAGALLSWECEKLFPTLAALPAN